MTAPGRAQSAAREDSGFAQDVRAGLTAAGQKRLPARCLYDALGSLLFEAITQLPEYGLCRAERALLERHAEDIARASTPAGVIELGSGSASKSALLLRPLLKRGPLHYWAVELSEAALEMTRRELGALPGLRVSTLQQEYLPGLEVAARARPASGRMLVLFLGSALGNFGRGESVRFLARLRRALRAGDQLLIGADLMKESETMRVAYDDALGVTAAFNRNLLVRMNRELGADFALAQFRHEARFNAATHDVEMHLCSRCEQVVQFTAPRFSVTFRAGESIHTESSHKYSPEELDELCGAGGFRGMQHWLEGEAHFLSALYEAV